MTASPITSFSFSEKEKEGKRKTAQGTAPRSEPRVAAADRDEIKSRGSMRLRPPRPPGERASRVRQTTEMLCTAEKVSVFGARRVCSASRAARPDLAFPLRGRCRRSRRMRCRFRTAEPFTGEKVTLFSVTRCRATPHHRLRAELPLEGKPRRMFAAGRLTVRALICPRCATCTESSPLIPHAVLMSPP